MSCGHNNLIMVMAYIFTFYVCSSRVEWLLYLIVYQSYSGFVSFKCSYPDAAEEDVKRYERSFKKLPPAHKVSYLSCSLALSFHFQVEFES